MFTKALILVLLSSSLVLAAPTADPTWSDSVKEWYESAVNSVEDAFNSASETVKEYYEKFKSNASEFSEGPLKYLSKKAVEAKDAILAKIKVINEKAVELSTAIKSSVGKTADEIAHEVGDIAKKAKETISKILAEDKQKWDEVVKGAVNDSAKKTE